MPELRINFEFLCALAPPKLFAQNPTSCWVVLPDFTKAKPVHVPVLLYDRPDRDDGALKKAGLAAVPAGESSAAKAANDPWEKLAFAGEELRIEPDGKAPTSDTLKTTSDLDAVLRIHHVDADLALIDKKLLDTADARVACRVNLRQGSLTVAKISKKIGVFKPKKVQPIYSQVMARQVVYSVAFSKFVDLVFRPLGGGAERRLRLKRSTSPGVVVTIRNCEEELVWKRGLPKYEDQSSDEINLFFTLAADYSPATKLPKFKLKKLAVQGHTGICAPKSFDGAK